MRDPARIDRMIRLLERWWRKHPDLRLAQLVGNAYPHVGDPYYMEDDVVEKALVHWITNEMGPEYLCECSDGGHDTGFGTCMCGGRIEPTTADFARVSFRNRKH